MHIELNNTYQRRHEALRMSLQSYDGLTAVTTETLINRAEEFDKFITEGKTDD